MIIAYKTLVSLFLICHYFLSMFSSLAEKDTSWQERVPQQESKKAGEGHLSSRCFTGLMVEQHALST